MTFLHTLFARTLLAFALIAGAGAAVAGPMYHVDIDTTKYSGAGGLQLTFLGAGSADPLTASVSNLNGAFVGTPELVDVALDNGVLTFANSGFSEFFQEITLGGMFGFDVRFDGDLLGVGGTTFNVGLLGADDYLALSAVSITLAEGLPPVLTGSEFGSAAAVPEPSTLLSLFTGIGLLGFTLRRRVR
jgi:hypothetical protein